VDDFELALVFKRLDCKATQAVMAERLTEELRRERHIYAEAQAEIASRLQAEFHSLIVWIEEHRAA
jgi:hypothetical protein